MKSSGAVGNLTYKWYMCIRSCEYTALFKTMGWIATKLEIFMVKTTSILVTLMNGVDSTKLFCKILDIYNREFDLVDNHPSVHFTTYPVGRGLESFAQFASLSHG